MMAAVETNQPYLRHPKTHLFTVRLWVEVLSPDQGEVRMQVKHVQSGEVRYFRDGWSLLAYLLTKVQEVACEHGASDDST